jgi:hypothetical protein
MSESGNAPEVVRQRLREAAKENPHNFIDKLCDAAVRDIDEAKAAKKRACVIYNAANEEFELECRRLDDEITQDRRRIADFKAIKTLL